MGSGCSIKSHVQILSSWKFNLEPIDRRADVLSEIYPSVEEEVVILDRRADVLSEIYPSVEEEVVISQDVIDLIVI